ncbi:aldo/keto reductase [Levilactobacillus suantsaii]|uniref:aldo/keto reductase n=1 Tax=Levilactobacillus suantsaii TaxID=2292255 RepID=UPI0015F3AEB5|nr:aldo/keto reductase [Levilactobacillus suantsaii]QMU08803.1 aldo/keto reductase [Levilactobacillus suantsaii]
MTFPKITMGTWAWGDSYFGNHYDEAHFKDVYQAAIAQGLTLWDTAYAYGAGASEKILGNLTQATSRDKLQLSTKFTPQLAGTAADDPVATMLAGSLDRLQTDSVDLYWIHNAADVERWTPALIPLLKRGQIKRVGVSNHNLNEIKRVQEILGAAGYHLSAIQNHLSLLDRTSEIAGILDYCHQQNLTFFAYMVLEQGALTGHYTTEHPFPEDTARAQTYNPLLPMIRPLVDQLTQIGQKYDLSAAQTAMAWAMSKGTLPIIGVTKVAQVNDAAQVAHTTLSVEDIHTLERTASELGVDTIREWEQNLQEN